MNHLEESTFFTEIIQNTAWLMNILTTLKDIGLTNIYIGAGVIRDVVWGHLHKRPILEPISDIDVVFFDLNSQDSKLEIKIKECLTTLFPQYQWDVTNQANVHQWYAEYFNIHVSPLSTLQEMIATWPETATSIAIKLSEDNTLDIIAPFGLTDLLNMIIRWNPTRISRGYYEQRIKEKQYVNRWPKVTIIY
ncbi:nucleotidyltransferase family protein [Neisseria sp. Ec49-e6-T10]|uniref:nucleotidyltransferase family protein n=1 Tax=Neisseria sp. Ec49-e6-T10 TaxID=3140744 RepID=UPI003EB73CE7